MKNIEMAWKEFNLNLEMVQSATKALAPDMILGVSAGSNLTIHCADEITEEQEQDIKDYLEALTNVSVEATSYKTASEIKTEQDAALTTKRASAQAKLMALGLTEEEVNAIIA